MLQYLPDWLKLLILPSNSSTITSSFIVVFVVMFAGILVGKLKIKRISLGISGIVFVGILFGHLGYRIHEETYEFMRDFGLILFVYAIGMQVGPSFFSRLKYDGLLYNSLAIGTVLLGGLCTITLFYLTHTGMDNLVGVMSGAVTNTPGLGAAKSALRDLSIHYPEKIFNDPTNAYAIAYPFGILGIIFVMIIGGKILKIDAQKETDEFQHQIRAKHPVPEAAKCRITSLIYIGKSIQEFISISGLNLIISRVKNSGSTIVKAPSAEYLLKERDVIMLVGLPNEIEKAITLLGYKSTDQFIESEEITMHKFYLVTQNYAVHKTLGQLNFSNLFQVKITRVYRSGMELLAQDDLILHYGDRIKAVGNQEDLNKIEKLVGNSEKKLQEPQLLSIFIGIIIGILIGSIPLFMPGLSVPIKLGMAAGPLLAAIIISRFGGIRSLHSYLQQSAMLFMKDFGISLFFAAIGIHAGASFYETFVTFHGWTWVAYGLLITLLPIVLMMLVARYVFKLNYLPLLGLIAGSYTDPAALDFCTNYYKSDLPLQAYATVYPLVTIARIIMAQILVLYFAI
jgi:putative transport protein